MPKEKLKARLLDCEDGFTERKSSGSASEVIRTVVGFANSVPEGRTGVLFIGVNDKGSIGGVDNPDKLQKSIRNMCEKECYPPIWANIEAINYDGKTVIAVEIPYSHKKPYFAGQAYIRRGSETITASDEMFHGLILQNIDKCRYILKYQDMLWTVEAVGKRLGDSISVGARSYRESAECKIVEVTAYYVRFKNVSSDQYITEEINFINITWDDGRNRPKVVARYKD